MIQLYSCDEYEKAKEKYKRFKWVIAIVTFLWVALFALILVWRRAMPYDPKGNDSIHRVLAVVITVAYLWFMTFFIGLPFRMCRGYLKLYASVTRGEDKPITAIFMGMDEAKTTIDGVDLNGLLFYEGLNKKGRDIIGKAYLDSEKEIDMEIGDKVLYCQKGGVLSGYEVIQKNSASLEDIESMLDSMKEHVDMDVVMIVDNVVKNKKLEKLEDMELRDDIKSDSKDVEEDK